MSELITRVSSDTLQKKLILATCTYNLIVFQSQSRAIAAIGEGWHKASSSLKSGIDTNITGDAVLNLSVTLTLGLGTLSRALTFLCLLPDWQGRRPIDLSRTVYEYLRTTCHTKCYMNTVVTVRLWGCKVVPNILVENVESLNGGAS